MHIARWILFVLILLGLVVPSQICLAKKTKPRRPSPTEMMAKFRWAENAMEKVKDNKKAYCVRLTKTINMVNRFVGDLTTYKSTDEDEALIADSFPTLLAQMEDKDKRECPLDLFTTERERELLRQVTAELRRIYTDRTCEEVQASDHHANELRTRLAKSWIISPAAKKERGEIIGILIGIQQENNVWMLEMNCPYPSR